MVFEEMDVKIKTAGLDGTQINDVESIGWFLLASSISVSMEHTGGEWELADDFLGRKDMDLPALGYFVHIEASHTPGAAEITFTRTSDGGTQTRTFSSENLREVALEWLESVNAEDVEIYRD